MSKIDAETVKAGQATEERGFEAEVAKLLKLMVHSVYSEREIFLRELVSNAADACDKRRYEAIGDPSLAAADGFKIKIDLDKTAKTITVRDNGIGMSRAELIENLGTIARSGTAGFAEKLTGDAGKDVQLIGQFGVGFYAVFMVADRVELISRRAGSKEAWRWSSSGDGRYTVSPADKTEPGTDICLHIKDDAAEFLEKHRLETIIRTYSDHIAHPISLLAVGALDGDGKPEAETTINEGSALWAKRASDVSEEQYENFYRHIAHSYDKPAMTLHYKAEGLYDYAALLFIPENRPHDLFDPARKSRVKLFVKRVFITDDTGAMLPGWLRFLRGVIDAQDLPLNISREMLQNNPMLRKISGAVSKKFLNELEKIADKDPARFEGIWKNFGAVIKEGIYEDFERRDSLLKLARFKSTAGEGWTSLSDYLTRMKDKQSEIYYISGSDEKALRRSPQLEGFKAAGVEVLLLSDPIDDFWLQGQPDFEGKPFKSATRGKIDLKDIAGEKTESVKEGDKEKNWSALQACMKHILGEAVKEVRLSERLTDTPACLIADEQAMDMHLERLLKAHQQLDHVSAKLFEINEKHPLILALKARLETFPLGSKAKRAGEKETDASEKREASDIDEPVSPQIDEAFADAVWLLFDQARILEGELPLDGSAFARRLAQMSLARMTA